MVGYTNSCLGGMLFRQEPIPELKHIKQGRKRGKAHYLAVKACGNNNANGFSCCCSSQEYSSHIPVFSSSPNRSLPNYLWCADIRQADSLQEAGDVIPAAGRPDEGVGLHGDVVGHQLGGLLAEGPAGVPHAVMVHPKPKTHHHTLRLFRELKHAGEA